MFDDGDIDDRTRRRRERSRGGREGSIQQQTDAYYEKQRGEEGGEWNRLGPPPPLFFCLGSLVYVGRRAYINCVSKPFPLLLLLFPCRLHEGIRFSLFLSIRSWVVDLLPTRPEDSGYCASPTPIASFDPHTHRGGALLPLLLLLWRLHLADVTTASKHPLPPGSREDGSVFQRRTSC